MAKKAKKRSARSEKNNAGCLSGLISIFDFRQGHSTQRLLSDRRHGSARHAGAAGSGNSKEKLNLLISSEDERESLNDGDNFEGRVDLGTSVKILIEEEMSRVHQPKKNLKPDTEQIRPLEVCYEKNHRKASETSVLSCDAHLNDKCRAMPDKSNNLNRTEKFSDKLHLAALLEEICGDRHQCERLLMDFKSIIDSSPSQERANKVPHDFLAQSDAEVVQDHYTIHKVLIEIAEALINQDVKAILSERSHQSEELVNALEILNSKESLLKLVQDPCSLLVKHIQEIKNDQERELSKPEACKVLKKSNVISRQSEEPISHKMFQKQTVHKFFWRKEKLQEAKVSNGNNGAQPLNKIVVLKPAPPRSQNSSNTVIPSSSQSCDSLRAEAEKKRVASHFSLKEIKRRLKHVIGDNRKGQLILSMDGVLHRIPYNTQQSGDSDCKSKDGGQAKSGIKTSHHKDQASQLPSSSKKTDKKLKLKESRSTIMCETSFQDKNLSITATTSQHRECNFQREARKHLVDMFNTVDGERNLSALHISKPLGRMLSLSEYNFLSPRVSPGREKESSLSPRRMRFSPLWQLKEENGKHSGPLRESIEDSPYIGTSRSLDQICDSDPNTQGQEDISDGEISRCENLSSGDISSPKGCTIVVEPLVTGHAQERGILNVPSKLNVGGPRGPAERSEEEQCSLSPRASTSEMSQTVTLLVPSTPIALLVDNIGSPDSIIEKPERPSPVSVLEPLFTEDVSSPVDCTNGHIDFQAQPCQIHYEEDKNSAVVLTTSCHGSNRRTSLEDKECRFEYVRAVLEASGLIQDLLSDRWHSSPLLSPSLYDEVEYSSDEFPDDLRHLFDSIGEVLEALRDKFFGRTPWVSFGKPSIQPLPSGENFIKEVWKGVDQHSHSESPHTLDQIVGKDMEIGLWMDLRSEIESSGVDMGNAILYDIMEETLLEF